MTVSSNISSSRKSSNHSSSSVTHSVIYDSLDCRLPGFSVHGILQARILEWIAVPFSRGSSQLRDQIMFPTLQADSLPSKLPIVAI